MKVLITVLLLCLCFCYTGITYAKNDNKNIQSYTATLSDSSRKEIVEIEDKYSTDGVFVLSVRGRNKTKDVIDSLVIPGKIRRLELVGLDLDGRQQILVDFDGPDNIPNIVIYQLKNNKLHRIFAVSSKYGVDTDFQGIPRVKVGKASKYNNTSTFLPAWDSWVWVGGKFVKE